MQNTPQYLNSRILLLTGIGTNFRIVGLTRQAFPVILIFQSNGEIL